MANREVNQTKGEKDREKHKKHGKVFDQTFFEKFLVDFFFFHSFVLFADGGGDGGSFETVTPFSSRHGCDCIRCQNDNLYINETQRWSQLNGMHPQFACNSLYLFNAFAPIRTRFPLRTLVCPKFVCVCMIRWFGDDKRVPEKCHESITRDSVCMCVCARSRPRCAVRGYRTSLR